jgi:gamma-glutamylcyclotransferase (GGCT)/AIG2-like uncharacterized protein YtfP
MAPGHSNSFLAVYGSLRRRAPAQRGFLVARSLSFFGHGILRGQLFTQNGYPGAVEGPGAIQVEIFRVRDQGVLQALDFYEGFSADSRGYNLFDRKVIRLLHPGIVATVYFLARQTPRGKPEFRSSAEAKRARNVIVAAARRSTARAGRAIRKGGEPAFWRRSGSKRTCRPTKGQTRIGALVGADKRRGSGTFPTRHVPEISR